MHDWLARVLHFELQGVVNGEVAQHPPTVKCAALSPIGSVNMNQLGAKAAAVPSADSVMERFAVL